MYELTTKVHNWNEHIVQIVRRQCLDDKLLLSFEHWSLYNCPNFWLQKITSIAISLHSKRFTKAFF